MGYISYIPSDVESLFVGVKTGDDPQIGGVLLQVFCSLNISEGKIIVEYGSRSLPEEEEFNSESTAIAFIKKKFPL